MSTKVLHCHFITEFRDQIVYHIRSGFFFCQFNGTLLYQLMEYQLKVILVHLYLFQKGSTSHDHISHTYDF